MAQHHAHNNVGKLDVGTGQYTFLLNDCGGIIDDLIVYRIGQREFLLVVNAARADEDFAWLQDHLPAANAVLLTNRSADFGGVAIQGLRIAEFFSRAVRQRCRSSSAKFDCRFSVRWNDCLRRSHWLHR